MKVLFQDRPYGMYAKSGAAYNLGRSQESTEGCRPNIASPQLLIGTALASLLLIFVTSPSAWASAHMRGDPIDGDLKSDKGLAEILRQVDSLGLSEKGLEQVNCVVETVRDHPYLYGSLMARKARYDRLMLKDPVKALETLSAVLLDAQSAREWKEKSGQVQREAMKTYKREVLNARRNMSRLPHAPPRMPVQFPGMNAWKMDFSATECVVEAGYALLALDRLGDALQVSKKVSSHRPKKDKVLASELAGDCFLRMQSYAKAVEVLTYALKVIDYSDSEDEYQEPLPSTLKYIKSRIQGKLKRAKGLAEMEALGRGYVKYREAEHLRRNRKNYVGAFLKYDELIQEFGNSVFAEAAKAYSVYCLVELSRQTKAPSLVNTLQKQVEKAKGDIRHARAILDPEAFKAQEPDLRKKVLNAEVRLRRAQAIPFSVAAIRTAVKRTTDFTRENELGLYRGELLVYWARKSFWKDLRPQEALRAYGRAWDWLDRVDNVEMDLSAYAVPGKVTAQSRPPQTEGHTNAWGIRTKHNPPVGSIVNRLTCNWYLNNLREECAMALGFLSFHKGDREAAMRWYKKLPALDQNTGALQREGKWNNYRRLMWAAENGYLYAYPQELRLYQGRQRFAVLVADFFFCTEQFHSAAATFQRLLKGELGQLSAAQRDYPQYGLTWCQYKGGTVAHGSTLKGPRAAIAGCRKVLATREHTWTEYRAMYMIAGLARQLGDEKLLKEGKGYLESMVRARQHNEFTLRARLCLAIQKIRGGERDEGLELLRTFPENDPEYKKSADYFLKKFTKEEEDE